MFSGQRNGSEPPPSHRLFSASSCCHLHLYCEASTSLRRICKSGRPVLSTTGEGGALIMTSSSSKAWTLRSTPSTRYPLPGLVYILVKAQLIGRCFSIQEAKSLACPSVVCCTCPSVAAVCSCFGDCKGTVPALLHSSVLEPNKHFRNRHLVGGIKHSLLSQMQAKDAKHRDKLPKKGCSFLVS